MGKVLYKSLLMVFFLTTTLAIAAESKIPERIIPIKPVPQSKTVETVNTPAPVKTIETAAQPAPVKTIETTPPAAEQTNVIPIEPVKLNNGGRLWNLQDADIISVINEVALETGKNFVIDPRVNGKITLVASKPIKPNEVYDVFLSVLSLLGYSAIPSGNVVKIVPNMESSEYATRIASRNNPGKGDEVVVRVIPLENVSANQLIPVVRPLLPQWSNITAYTPGNVIILVGRAANLERIVNIISSIDKTADSNIEIIHLHQASAGQVATVLNNLQNASRTNGETSHISVAADERSNSILLSGNKAARMRARILITQLDTPSSGVQGNTEVVYLKYLKAKDFAPILGKIAQNILGKDSGKDVAVTVNTSNQTTPTSNPNKFREAENFTNIQAEPSTNSLIITAPPTLMRSLISIIAKLDIRPAQVLIEGIIVELNQKDFMNLGLQWGSLVTPETVQPGPGFSKFGEGVIGIIPGQPIQSILNVLQNLNNVNILSTPSVVVLDNQKALLDIGQDVPVQTGSYATTGSTSTVTPFNTTSYKKVALVLEVIPQINLANAVRLTVKLKNDSLQHPNDPGLTPLINTSQINNSVIINNCDVLVIGGLISNNITDATKKVPILGDVPGLGLLFQNKIRQLEKKNLVVFLRPRILHNEYESNLITHQKYENTREAQMKWPEEISTGKLKTENVLPLWKNNVKLPLPFDADA